MIDEVLRYVVGSMNQFFKARFGLNEDIVLLSGLVNIDGTPALTQDNKIVVTLLNIEPEKVTSTMGNQLAGRGSTSSTNPPVYVNLHVLFTGYFPGSNYAESLKFISGVIAFFQSNASLQRSDSGSLPPYMDKLVFDLQKFSYLELNQVWGMLGAKHMPSVCYRLRMLAIDEQHLQEQRPAITQVPPQLQRS